MRPEDIDQVLLIEKKVFPYPWPRYFFEADLASDQAIKFVAVSGEQIIGYCLGTIGGPELHITNVAIDPKFHHQGIGSKLLRLLEVRGRKAGCVEAYLEVRVSNQPAINMYKRNGYEISYTRRYYYLDGEDAYIMKKTLKGKKETDQCR